MLVGCSDGSPSAPTTTGSDTSTSTTFDGPSDDATTDAPLTTGEAGGFVTMPDVGALPQCTLYADDCAKGSKCMPYATDGGSSPDATRCVELVPEPAGLGDPCGVDEWIASGVDSCDRGLYCVVWDVRALVGECVADPDQPDLVCTSPDDRCIGSPDVLPRLCSSGCDPFGDDCPGDRSCYRINDHFTCLEDASGTGGGYGEECLFTNDCDAGMLCADPPEFFECGSTEGCCTPFCDTRDPDASASCPGAPEHRCEPLFDPGEGPPLYDWVGACVVPTKNGP
jgi:hypothetical protein